MATDQTDTLVMDVTSAATPPCPDLVLSPDAPPETKREKYQGKPATKSDKGDAEASSVSNPDGHDSSKSIPKTKEGPSEDHFTASDAEAGELRSVRVKRDQVTQFYHSLGW